MRSRLVASTAFIALASVLVLGIPLGLVEAARVRADSNARLEREADAVASAIDDRLEAGRPLSPATLSRYVRTGHRVRIRPTRGRAVTVGYPIDGAVRGVHAGSSRGAAVVAEAPADEVEDRILHTWLLLAGLAAGGVAAAVLLALLQARRLARPLESLAVTSSDLGRGDFSTRAGHFAIPEIDELARVLDTTAERIARLVAREREFSANVSHQLRTPLTALRLRLEELEAQASTAGTRDEVEAALGEVDRVERTIADLLEYARREQAGEASEIDLGELARRNATAWRALLGREGRGLELEVPGAAIAWASAGAIGQVLDVLLENALRHGGGNVRVTVAGDGVKGRIVVSDEGGGISPEDAERIFDRGASSTGTGIGLHVAQVLARADGGELRLSRPAPPEFELVLPAPRVSGEHKDA